MTSNFFEIFSKQNQIYGVLFYQFPALQQTSTVKFLGTFLTFQTKERVLRVNKSNITCGNTFNGNFSEIEDNHEQSKYENTWS